MASKKGGKPIEIPEMLRGGGGPTPVEFQIFKPTPPPRRAASQKKDAEARQSDPDAGLPAAAPGTAPDAGNGNAGGTGVLPPLRGSTAPEQATAMPTPRNSGGAEPTPGSPRLTRAESLAGRVGPVGDIPLTAPAGGGGKRGGGGGKHRGGGVGGQERREKNVAHAFVDPGLVRKMDQVEESLDLMRRSRHDVDQLLLECWLNDALADKPPPMRTRLPGGEPELDGTLHSAPGTYRGLNQFGLHRGELQRAGLKPAEVERLYRSLYVYTVGFHDFLKETFSHVAGEARLALVSSVWSSFVAIAERSITGHFKSDFLQMMTTIEHQRQQLHATLSRLDTAGDEASRVQAALFMVSEQHAQELAHRQSLEEHMGTLTHTVEQTKRTTAHVQQKYIVEVEHRSEITAQLVDCRKELKETAAARDEAEEVARQHELTKAPLVERIAELEERLKESQEACEQVTEEKEALQVMVPRLETRIQHLAKEAEISAERLKDEVKSKVFLQTDLFNKKDRILELEVQNAELHRDHVMARDELSQETSKAQGLAAKLSQSQQSLREAAIARDSFERDFTTAAKALKQKREKKKFWKAKSTRLEASRLKLVTDLSATRMRLEGQMSARWRAENVLEAAQLAAEQHRVDMHALGTALATMTGAARANQAARKVSSGQISHLKGELASAVKRVDEARAETANQKGRSDEMDNLRAAEAVKVRETQERLASIAEELKGSQSEVRQLTSDLEDSVFREGELTKQLASLGNDGKQLYAEKVEVERVLAEERESSKGLREVVATLEDEVSRQKGMVSRLRVDLERERSDLKGTMATLSSTQMKLREEEAAHSLTQGELAKRLEEIEGLEKDVAKLEGQLKRKREKKRAWKKGQIEQLARANGLAEKKLELEGLLAESQALATRLGKELETEKEERQEENLAAADAAQEAAEALAAEQNKYKNASARVQALVKEKHDLEAERQTLLGKILDRDKKIEELQAEAAHREAIKNFLKAEVETLKIERGRSEETLEAAEQEIQSLKDILEGKDNEMERRINEHSAQFESRLTNVSSELSAERGSHLVDLDIQRQEVEEAVRILRSNYDAKIRQRDGEMRDYRKKAESAIEELNQVIESKDGDVEEREAEKSVLRDMLKTLEGELEEANNARAEADKRELEAQSTIAELEAILVEVENRAAEAHAEVRDVSRRAGVVRSWLQTVPKMIKEVMVEEEDGLTEEERAAAAEQTTAEASAELTGVPEEDDEEEEEDVTVTEVVTEKMVNGVRTVERSTMRQLHLPKNRNRQHSVDIGHVGGQARSQLIFTHDSGNMMKLTDDALQALILQMYVEKIENDSAVDGGTAIHCGDPELRLHRFGMEEVVYDYFIQRLGIRSIAEQHLGALLEAVDTFAGEPRVEMFGRLCGLLEPEIPPEGMQFFMHFLSSLINHSAEHGGLIHAGENLPNYLVRSDVALEVFESHFKGLTKERLVEGRSRVSELDMGDGVDLDHLMDAMMKLWTHHNLQNDKHLREIMRRISDKYPQRDGIVTYEDFFDIVKKTSRRYRGDVRDREVKAMYRAAVRMSGQKSNITPEAFSAVLRRFGVMSLAVNWDGKQGTLHNPPPFNHWRLLGDSWHVQKPVIMEELDALQDDRRLSDEVWATRDKVVELEAAMEERESATAAWTCYRRILASHLAFFKRVTEKNAEERNRARRAREIAMRKRSNAGAAPTVEDHLTADGTISEHSSSDRGSPTGGSDRPPLSHVNIA